MIEYCEANVIRTLNASSRLDWSSRVVIILPMQPCGSRDDGGCDLLERK
jgi:hypothetical protein